MSSEKVRIIDCFLFYNETDLLEYRLNLLWDIVDLFVITESSRTFTGKPKPFFTDDTRFDPFRSKIFNVRLNTIPYPDPDVTKNQQWDNENYQRDGLNRGMNDLRPHDIVLLSDVDEIPDPMSLNYLASLPRETMFRTVFVMKQKYHCYNITVVRDIDWYHPKAFTYETWTDVLKCSSLSRVRMFGIQCPFPCSVNKYIIESGGWHLSYFGSPEFIQNKLSNFSHQEFVVSFDDIVRRMTNSEDIMGQSDISYTVVPFEKNTYLPPIVSSFMFFSISNDSYDG